MDIHIINSKNEQKDFDIEILQKSLFKKLKPKTKQEEEKALDLSYEILTKIADEPNEFVTTKRIKEIVKFIIEK